MRGVLPLLLLILTTSSFAGYKVGIVDILAPEQNEAYFNVMATDGQIYQIDRDDEELIEKAHIAKDLGQVVKLRLSDAVDTEDFLELRTEILDIKIRSELIEDQAHDKLQLTKNNSDQNLLMTSYITNFDEADASLVDKYFSKMRMKFRGRSQCYNRAYVWSWEMSLDFYKGRRVQTGKTWLFFTREYIRQYKYKWWFHIAPYLMVNNEIKMMDRSFMRKVGSVQDWTDEFIYTKETCKVAQKYSDYKDYPDDRSCFVIFTNTFFWQPYDIENAGKNGTTQAEWKSFRLKKAYKNAVGIFAKPPKR